MTLIAQSIPMHIIELLFGGESVAGGGRQSSLDWAAPWATWVTLALLIAAAIFVIAIYARESGTGIPFPRLGYAVALAAAIGAWIAWCVVYSHGTGVTLGGAATLVGIFVGVAGLLMLARSRWGARIVLAAIRFSLIALALFMLYHLVLRPYKTDLPDLIVVLDDSASMAFADKYNESSRTSAIQARLQSVKLDAATRANLAKALLLENDADLLEQLGERYNVKYFLAAGSLRPLSGDGDATKLVRDMTADQPDSRLGQCLLDILQAQRGRPTAAMIVLTDGITTEGKTVADAADVARRKLVPLFIVGLGNDQPLRDVWVSDVLADEIAFVGDVVPFEFKVSATGFAGQTMEVRLREKSSGRIVDQTRISLGADGQPVGGRLRHRPQRPGEFEYEIEVVSPEGDSNDKNNQLARTVQVRDETIRVLLVQDYPNYEFRYLKNLLSRQLKVGGEAADGKEKAIELSTVLQSGSRDYAALDETALAVFPVKREELFKYDVIIFGDVDPAYLSRSVMENIAAFVKERGGGIIFTAGAHYTPLAYRGTPIADLLPINLDVATAPPDREILTDAFQMQPTGSGITKPQLQLDDSPAESLRRWQKLPGMYWYLEAPELKPGADVLAEHPTRTGSDGRPLAMIISQYVGAGNVVFHATDETWRWRFRIGDALFGRYWLQTIRALSRAKLLGKARAAEVTTDRNSYRRGDIVNLRVRFFNDREAPAQDDGVAVVVEQDGGRNRRITLRRASARGVFESTLTGLGPGRYRAWMAAPAMADGAPTTDFTVEDPGGELAKLQMDARDLKAAAERSGGKFYTFETAGRVLDDLPAGRQVPIEALDPISIWNSHLLAGLFVVLLVTEWLLRKRAGMI